MRLLRALVIIASATASAGCFVKVEHVANPESRFRAALDEAGTYQGRSGPAREPNVLVYDSSDGEMVRVSIPVWLANKLVRHVKADDIDLDSDDSEADQRVARALKRSLRRGDLRDLSALPLGILASVESDDERVLVWMK